MMDTHVHDLILPFYGMSTERVFLVAHSLAFQYGIHFSKIKEWLTALAKIFCIFACL